MALKNSKGFVYTLEAILASALILGVVLTLIPNFQEEPNTQPQQQVRSGLETLDDNGELSENLAVEEIEDEIRSYVPSGYNYSVSLVETKSVSGSLSDLPKFIEGEQGYSEIQFWINSSNNLNVSFDNETLLEDYSGSGYETFSVSASEGWLNSSSGSGELEYSFDSYISDSADLDQDEVSVVNYIVLENGTKEVQVRIWQ